MVAAFKFEVTGVLSVSFTDISSGNFVSRLWDFGDGETSTEKDIIHTYDQEGYYTISLTISSDAEPPVTDSYSIDIGLSIYGLALNARLSDYVNLGLPNGITFEPALVKNLIQKWQTLVGPSVIPEISNYYVELFYPILYGQLVGDLILYDLILKGAQNYLLSLGWKEDSNGTQLKSITTGPASAEWFEGSEIWKAIMSSGGLLESIRAQICTTAAKLRLNFSICKKLALDIFPPSIYKPEKLSPNYPAAWEGEQMGES